MVWLLRQTIEVRTCQNERSYVMDPAGGWFEISWSIGNRLEAARSPERHPLSRSKNHTGSVKDLAIIVPRLCGSFSRAGLLVFTNHHLSLGSVRQNHLGLLLAGS